ncbi:MAG: phosphatidylglycerophosphatase A [Opitutales bacterium]|nr:phosphatidylglycerophosphatase A [Opitutales bacterium]
MMDPRSHPSLAWARLLPDRWVVEAARCGPLGRVRKGPGTVGSVGGLALYAVVFYHLSLPAQILLGALLVYLAVVLCGEAEARLAKRDPGEIVLDEVVAVPLCFLALRPWMEASGYVWAWVLAGFVLFRFFDIAKPLGIGRLQKWPGGAGVVADDVAAALATAVVLHIAARLLVTLPS